jgi:hypothetical protein
MTQEQVEDLVRTILQGGDMVDLGEGTVIAVSQDGTTIRFAAGDLVLQGIFLEVDTVAATFETRPSAPRPLLLS